MVYCSIEYGPEIALTVSGEVIMKLAASCILLGMLLGVEAQAANPRPGDERYVLPPLGHTIFCMQYPQDCARTEPAQGLPISLESRWRKMNLVNNSVNAAITPRANVHRLGTHWRAAPREGNCNDYAVTKRHELLKAGWSSSSLLLAEVTLISTGEHHLVLVVKGAQINWVLDNLRGDIVTLTMAQNDYVLNRMESSADSRYWIDLSKPTRIATRY
jgi:predicted transglutaminase-like cysteine proteinase